MSRQETRRRRANGKPLWEIEPDSLLRHVLEKEFAGEDLAAVREEIKPVFFGALPKNTDHPIIRAICEQWFSMHLGKLIKSVEMAREPIEKRRAARAAERTVAKAEATVKAMAIRERVLLDLLLPSGKKLRDATGAECRKAGGWFTAIAERVRPRQTVGNVLTEADLRALLP